ncbi:hypothetical protein A2T82_31560 [Burkholderia cenocepacia]|nr:hypothetical protein A2T82_31560 [Burkholderia cenocepacia]
MTWPIRVERPKFSCEVSATAHHDRVFKIILHFENVWPCIVENGQLPRDHAYRLVVLFKNSSSRLDQQQADLI